MDNRINKLLEQYYDSKITKNEFEDALKKLGIDKLIEFIVSEV